MSEDDDNLDQTVVDPEDSHPGLAHGRSPSPVATVSPAFPATAVMPRPTTPPAARAPLRADEYHCYDDDSAPIPQMMMVTSGQMAQPHRLKDGALNPISADEHPLLAHAPAATPDVGVPRALLEKAKEDDVEFMKPGQRFGDFVIKKVLAWGGMGVVYHAEETSLGREVALKTLWSDGLQSAEAIERFKREARSASQVIHQNVVVIHSLGVADRKPYIAMEYLRGQSLGERLEASALPIERGADIMLAVCSGVFAAHRKGVIHRDIKPSNIFLAQGFMGEIPKVVDFGISKLSLMDKSLTGTDMLVGTQLYMSPEQIISPKDLTAASDQYALGVVLYQCLAGRLPYTEPDFRALAQAVLNAQFSAPRNFNPQIPQELSAVVMRAMALKPDDRFESVRTLGRALLPFASTNARNRWTEFYQAPDSAMPATRGAIPRPVFDAAPPAPGKPTAPTAQQPPPARPIAPTKILPVKKMAETRTSTRVKLRQDLEAQSVQKSHNEKRLKIVALGVGALAVAAALWFLIAG